MTPNKRGRKYATKGTKDKDVYLQSTTLIDPATGWIEVRPVLETNADLVANKVELALLTPLSNKTMKDIVLACGDSVIEIYKLRNTTTFKE